jgi:hypothetical protein
MRYIGRTVTNETEYIHEEGPCGIEQYYGFRLTYSRSYNQYAHNNLRDKHLNVLLAVTRAIIGSRI